MAEWVGRQLGLDLSRHAGAIGIIDERGILLGGSALTNRTRFDVEVLLSGTVTVGLTKATFRLAFEVLGVLRVTARVARRNKQMVRALPRLGFSHEGLARRLCGPTRNDDAILFGLLRSEAARYLKNRSEG